MSILDNIYSPTHFSNASPPLPSSLPTCIDMPQVSAHVDDGVVGVEDKPQARHGLKVMQRVGVGPQVVQPVRRGRGVL